MADLYERLASAEQQLIELREQITTADREAVSKAEVDAALDDFDRLWDSLCPRERVRALRLLAKRIDDDGAEGKVAISFHANGIRTLGQDARVESLEAVK